MEVHTGRNGAEAGSRGYVLFVSLVATLGGLLFGYDTAVISGAIGPLIERFSLDAAWEGWTASSALLGCVIGAAVAGALSDALGRRKALMLTAVLFLVSAVGTALPRTLTQLIVFRIIGGVGVGAAAMTSPMYIAEISPARIRGRMVSLNQLAIVSGMLVVYFVNYVIALQGDKTWAVQTGWRYMFGSEAIPAVLFLLMLFFVPESPRWLVKRGRDDQALGILTRVGGQESARREVAEIRATLRQEEDSLLELLRPGWRLVLAIGVTLAVLQQITGINVFLYYAPEIFKGMGVEDDKALLQTILVGATNMLFTLVAIRTVDRLGRKPLMLIGASGMGVSLFAMGFAAYLQTTGLWVLFFVLTYIASFALSLGPVVWVVLSEIFPTKIRGRAMGLATVCLWCANLLVSQTFPMIDENPWLVERFHHGFSFWIYGFFCLITIGFVALVVPETKGRSLEEIETMWMEKQS